MATVTSTEVVKFHLSLNVSDLRRALAFYEVLFNQPPAKLKEDYAKFEVDEPPLIMSLIPTPPGPGGALNHIGLRLLDAQTLVAMQARLEQAGYATQREEGVECCYSKQTKFWVTDPDRTLWELYILHGDADEHDDHPQSAAGALPILTVSSVQTSSSETPSSEAPSIDWQHLLVQPLPARIEHADQSVDSVQLQGTLNMQVAPAELAAFLAEVRRVLKPGGKILSHNLTADRPLTSPPVLPGPAALVQHVPVESAAVAALAAAGFVHIEITKLGAKPCFTVGESELRETKLVGYQPQAAAMTACGSTQAVLYRGPLREVLDDFGNRYPRGERVSISPEAVELLRSGPAAGQFTFFGASHPAGGCCS